MRTDVNTKTDDTMDIRILYFASLADDANCHEESISVPKTTTLPELYEQLRQKHHFSPSQAELRVAVNDYFANWDDPISDGDSVVFITPVAGG